MTDSSAYSKYITQTLKPVSTAPYRNLVLAGYMGIGKREVAEQIAMRFQAPLRDLDAEITAREGMAPERLRELYGEARLHGVETELCRELVLQRGAVVSVSASTILMEANRRRLQESGVILVLVTALNEALRRLHTAWGDRFHDPRERAIALARLRAEWQVRTLPGLPLLDTTPLSLEQVAEEAGAFWRTTGEV